jgi:hypothetical protein
LLRKLDSSDWAFLKLCSIKSKLSLSQNPEYIVQEMVSKLPLPWISISCDYKKILKSPEMLTTWDGNVGIAPTHSEKQGPSPKCVFDQSLQKVCSCAHDI